MGGGVVMAVQRQQRKDRCVDALSQQAALHVVETIQQVIAAHIGGILTDGGQCKDHTGILGGLCTIQTTVAVNILLDILDHIVVVPGGYGAAAASQPQCHPLAADAAHSGSAQRGDIITGGGVDVAVVRGRQHRQLDVLDLPLIQVFCGDRPCGVTAAELDITAVDLIRARRRILRDCDGDGGDGIKAYLAP